MNPSLKFILVLIISLEVSLKANLLANLILIFISLVYLLVHRISLKELALLFLVPLIAAIAIFIAIYYSPKHDLAYAWILFTRLYTFVFLGACLTKTTTATQLSRSLEQNLHMPSKFAYGTLAAFNVLPKIAQEVKRIHATGQMRGMDLSFYSPRLYFKAILSAISWADGLNEAMLAHGYRENETRSVIEPISLTKKDWLLFFAILLIFQPILFYVVI